MDRHDQTALDAAARLEQLIRQHLRVKPGELALDLSAAPGEWEAAIRTLGRTAAYERMGALCCRLYREQTGRDFLFSDACVGRELGWHMDAYLWTQGYRWPRPLLTRALSRAALEAHCRSVEIAEADLHNFRQRIVFGYRRGLRR